MAINDSETHPFRNGDAGAQAQRSSLLRNRRDDLATMSHSIRRVYVNRVSRISATIVLSLGGALLLTTTWNSSLEGGLSELIPGVRPAPLATALLATWIIGVVFFLLGRSLAEHRFNIAMSKAVLPTNELHTDVARLKNESPNAVGKRMARRLEVISRLSPVLAAGLILPATGVAAYSIAAADNHTINLIETHLFKAASAMILLAVLTAALASSMAFRPNMKWGAFTIGSGIAALGVLWLTSEIAWTVGLAGMAAVGFTAMRSQARHLNENSLIDQEGTPLPAIFSLKATFRNALRHCYKFSVRTFHFCKRRQLTMGVALLLVGIGTAYATLQSDTPHTLASTTKVGFPQPAPSPSPDSPPTEELKEGFAVRAAESDFGVQINFQFENAQAINATQSLHAAKLPQGFAATVTVTMVEGDNTLFLDGLAGTTPRMMSSFTPQVDFEYSNCTGSDIPLHLLATPYGQWPTETTKAVLRYEVQLEMITCSTAGVFR